MGIIGGMMEPHQLRLSQTRESDFVFVDNVNGHPPNCQFASGSLPHHRVSPIFPAFPDATTLPDTSQPYYVYLYFSSNPFEQLKLLEDARGNHCVWFSHGLASIIGISSEQEILNSIGLLCEPDLYAIESWYIENSTLLKSDIKYIKKPTDVDRKSYSIVDYRGLNQDHKFLIVEISNCLNVATTRSAQVMPTLLPLIRKQYKFVNDLIEEIKYLEFPETPKPEAWTDTRPSEQLDINERTKRIHQATGLLVQLNSQLSYVISQAFAGMPPIKEYECQIRSFSLLGVGIGFKALTALTGHIENTFSDFPVDNAIEERYNIRQSFEVFADIAKFKPDQWEDLSHIVDEDIELATKDEYKSKLVAFSGRQGFRETEPAVTVPLWVLSLADTGRWSLMTISHELLHGHVKGLLGSIFGNRQLPLTNSSKTWISRYNEVQGDPKLLSEFRHIDCLRFIIMNYCASLYSLKTSLLNSGGDYSRLNIDSSQIEDIDDFLSDFSEAYRDVSELVTHVLDFYYFYDGNVDLYLGLLWASWTPVPAVRDNINKYLLRSLVTVGTKKSGTIITRFNDSLNDHVTALKDLSLRKPENRVVKIALERLGDQQVIKYLKAFFYPGIYVAQMAKCFLKSIKVHGVLTADESADWVEAKRQSVYNIEDCKFPGYSIQSPIAFVLDRLRRRLKEVDTQYRDEHKACWILLACASCSLAGREE